jgi:hypothetical protein
MFTALLVKFGIGAAAAMVGWIGSRLARLIGTKNASSAQRAVLARLEDAVRVAVAAVEQTVRKQLGEKIKDPALLKQSALDIACRLLGAPAIDNAAKVLGVSRPQLLDSIGDRIEAAVLALKNKAGA